MRIVGTPKHSVGVASNISISMSRSFRGDFYVYEWLTFYLVCFCVPGCQLAEHMFQHIRSGIILVVVLRDADKGWNRIFETVVKYGYTMCFCLHPSFTTMKNSVVLSRGGGVCVS